MEKKFTEKVQKGGFFLRKKGNFHVNVYESHNYMADITLSNFKNFNE